MLGPAAQATEREHDGSWGDKAQALAEVERVSDENATNRRYLEESESKLRRAIKSARKADIPDVGIAEVAGLSTTRIREIAGARGARD